MAMDRFAGAQAAPEGLSDFPEALRGWAAAALKTMKRGPVAAGIGPVQGGTITLLKGPRGSGKSWLTLTLAHRAASGGGALDWGAETKTPVLYVDAAMPGPELAARLTALGDPPEPLTLLSGDVNFDTPDLGEADARAGLELMLPERGGMLVLDGLDLLVPPGRGSRERWREFQRWLRSLRRQGHAVVIVDRAPRREIEGLADTVIAVKPDLSASADAATGPRLILNIASRHALPLADRAFVAALDLTDGSARWSRGAVIDDTLRAVAALANDGKTVREIAAETGTSTATAWRALARAKALGLARDSGGCKPPETGETAERSAPTAAPAPAPKPETAAAPALCFDKPRETDETGTEAVIHRPPAPPLRRAA